DWQNTCESNNHFVDPMQSGKYEELFVKFIYKNFNVDYKKGEVPFALTQDVFLQLFENLKSEQFKFKNDFGMFLMNLYHEKLLSLMTSL
ncbi:hypothetical protein, partial [Succinimonas sp.]|uniref:hypothetical protein n=1 Tax=Succinimonas sp. TaxID=1936151 RepID=UPI00386310AC